MGEHKATRTHRSAIEIEARMLFLKEKAALRRGRVSSLKAAQQQYEDRRAILFAGYEKDVDAAWAKYVGKVGTR